MRIKSLLELVSFIGFLLGGHAALAADVDYQLLWNQGNLKVEVKTLRALETVRNRISEKGIYSPELNLPIKEQMPDGIIKLKEEEEAYIYILIKNKGSKPLRFSVAPHSIGPGAAALGFRFNCLCNGHIYEVRPGEIWYKIMSLKNNKWQQEKKIVLTHDIFEVKKFPGKKGHSAHAH
jgi:hypothetical protein